MRSNGAVTVVGSPKVSASAVFAPPAASCTYTIEWNMPHRVGRRVNATRLSELVSSVLAMRSRRSLRCLGNGATSAQTFNLGRGESQFLQNVVVVLADIRRAHRRHLDDAMHLNRTADRRRQLAASA